MICLSFVMIIGDLIPSYSERWGGKGRGEGRGGKEGKGEDEGNVSYKLHRMCSINAILTHNLATHTHSQKAVLSLAS